MWKGKRCFKQKIDFRKYRENGKPIRRKTRTFKSSKK